MRKLKLFIIFISLLFAFILIIIICLPSKIIVSNTVIINASEQKVTEEINDFTNWKNWFPPFQDPKIIAKIIQTNDTAYALLTNAQHQQLKFVLNKSQANATTILLLNSNSTKELYRFTLINKGNNQIQLTWDVDIEFSKYSWKKFSEIFIDKIEGVQCRQILNNLKNVSENNRL